MNYCGNDQWFGAFKHQTHELLRWKIQKRKSSLPFVQFGVSNWIHLRNVLSWAKMTNTLNRSMMIDHMLINITIEINLVLCYWNRIQPKHILDTIAKHRSITIRYTVGLFRGQVQEIQSARSNNKLQSTTHSWKPEPRKNNILRGNDRRNQNKSNQQKKNKNQTKSLVECRDILCCFSLCTF